MFVTLGGRRLLLRPLGSADFEQWQELRRRSAEWLGRWEPSAPAGQSMATDSRAAFGARCSARDREWQLGAGYGFGIFVGDTLAGEINLSAVQRGPFQNAYVGYWIDRLHAGNGYVPEAFVVVARYAFEDLGLHRLQVAVIPRNQSSRRVAEKLGLRDEGIARRYLQINGIWEDHVRYAITVEEWVDRRQKLLEQWIESTGGGPGS